MLMYFNSIRLLYVSRLLVFGLKISEPACDREGNMAEKKLHNKYKELGLGKLKDGNISIFDGAELMGDGQLWYNKYATNGVVCLDNWGFMGDTDSHLSLPLPPRSSSSRSVECPWKLGDQLGLNMYRFMLSNGIPKSLHDKKILEVGCGRGKGSAMIAQQMKPQSYTGIDLNSERIALAKEFWGDTQNLYFEVGNAMALKQEENKVDIVLNVESSFHYPDFSKFVSEVHRVLKHGGLFLWTAPLLNRGDTFQKKVDAFTQAGFIILQAEDITRHVVKSRDTHIKKCMEDEFKFLCNTLKDQDSLWNWFGLQGSMSYHALKSHEIPYLHFVLQKKK